MKEHCSGPIAPNTCQSPVEGPVSGSITFLPDELRAVCIAVYNTTGADKEIRVERVPGRDAEFTVKAIPGENTTQVKFYVAEPGLNEIRLWCKEELLAERIINYII